MSEKYCDIYDLNNFSNSFKSNIQFVEFKYLYQILHIKRLRIQTKKARTGFSIRLLGLSHCLELRIGNNGSRPMTGVNTQALSRIVLGLNLRDLSEILVSLEGSICNYILLIRSLHLMHNFLYLMHVLDVLKFMCMMYFMLSDYRFY